MKTVKYLLVIFVSLVFAGPSQGNPSSWFSAPKSTDDALSAKDAQLIMARLNQLEAEIDSLKALLRGKVLSSETEHKDLLEKKASFSFELAPKVAYPTECNDLTIDVSDDPANQMMKGIPGIYLLRNNDKIEAVHCDFTDITSPVATPIGIAEVLPLTGGVHFSVLKNQPFSVANGVVTFELVLLNEGGGATGGWDPEKNTFTAPVSGTYHFSFNGIKDTTATTVLIYLRRDGFKVASALAGAGSNAALTLQVTLDLNKGSKVDLFKEGAGVLFETASSQYTSFSGSLVDTSVTFP